MTDDQSASPQDGEQQGKAPPKPPPQTGPVPMTASRARLGSGSGSSPAPTANRARAAAPAAAPETASAPRQAEQPAAAVERSPQPESTAQTPTAAARPAATPPEKPTQPEADPEEAVKLRETFPDLEWKRVYGYVELKVQKERLLDTARRLRDDLDYDYLSAITAVDWLDRIEMVYHLFSFNYLKRPTGLVLRVDLERPDYPDYPLCPSLTTLWPGANFQEREVYDLMGVKFIGHPDLRRILLADDFPGHPLRKDFVFDYEYVLVRHLSYGVEGQFAPTNGEEVSAK